MKLFFLTCVSVLITVCIIAFSIDTTSTEVNTGVEPVRAPLEHQRPADQTFLTYPEWFLVFSPEEFAAFSKTSTPDDFPFFGHVGQFWQAYAGIYDVISEKYPFNAGYHVMIMVIGLSTTVEYSLRECYEKVVGRVSRLSSSDDLTEEDRYAARVAQEYVDLIKVLPWYEFDFKERLVRLWQLPASGENVLRKWERRYILTTDYGAKAIYGWLIKKMTKASYEEPLPVTAVVIDQLVLPVSNNIQTLEIYSDSTELILLPRYDAFKDELVKLARNGVNFTEIAGNKDVILVTCIVPASFSPLNNVKVLFSQPILTKPAVKRIAFVVPIASLGMFLRRLDANTTLEHVYDF
jgi:hypothetical protein